MIKKCAQDMTFDDFKQAITPKMLNELSKMNISCNRAYNIFQEELLYSDCDELDEIGTMDNIVKRIVLDYSDLILANAYSEFAIDVEK